MTVFLKVIGLLTVVVHCNGFSKLNHANKRIDNSPVFRLKSGRRFEFPQGAVIIGAPSYPNHLPEAEPILPGHTLIRPGLGMLKSALKYPHRELESGSGVYGNWDNLGIRYDGRNERVLYTGFRRLNSNDPIVLFLPSKSRSHNVKTEKDKQNEILSRIQDMLSGINKHRKWKSLFEKEYSSEEIREPGQGNGRDKLLSVMTKDKYLNMLIKSIQRRFKHDNTDDKLENHEKRLEKKFFEQNKHIYNEFQMDGNPEDNNLKEVSSSDTSSSSSSSSSEDINITPKANNAVTQNPNAKTQQERKLEWFWQTKDAGNHIKINPNALDYKEFLPTISGDNEMDDIRSWWYFNQADHTNLQDKRRRQ